MFGGELKDYITEETSDHFQCLCVRLSNQSEARSRAGQITRERPKCVRRSLDEQIALWEDTPQHSNVTQALT